MSFKLVLSEGLLQAIPINRISFFDNHQSLEDILCRNITILPADTNGDKRPFVTVFAVTIAPDGRILTVRKRGELILGFGSKCDKVPNDAGKSIINAIAFTLYSELDLYIHDTSYRVSLKGFILSDDRLSDDRAYDRTNIGLLFKASLKNIPALIDVGEKNVSLMTLSGIDPQFLRGWSKLIHQEISNGNSCFYED